jgi:hypothetical protein
VGEELLKPGGQDGRCGGGLAELPVEVAQQLAESIEISLAGGTDEDTATRIHRQRVARTNLWPRVDIDLPVI